MRELKLPAQEALLSAPLPKEVLAHRRDQVGGLAGMGPKGDDLAVEQLTSERQAQSQVRLRCHFGQPRLEH